MAQAKSGVVGIERVIVTIIALLALVIAGYAYIHLSDVRQGMTQAPSLDEAPIPNKPPADDGAKDILLVGTDARTDANGKPLPKKILKALRTELTDSIRTDTIIILRMPDDGSDPTAVSLPRDTWVDVPNGGKGKINSAYHVAKSKEMNRLAASGDTDRAEMEQLSNDKGRMALIQTVQDLTKIRIDHYAEVSLLGFYLLSDAVGGVEVCLNQKTKDAESGANFKAGRQKISGTTALSFVRQRKNLPRGDLDRIVRQQTFLSAALNKVLSTGTLSDSSKMDRLIDAVNRSMVLDADMDIGSFATKAKGMASGDVEFETIPVTDLAATSPDGQSIVTVDDKAVRSYVRKVVQKSSKDGSGGGGSATSSGPPCIN